MAFIGMEDNQSVPNKQIKITSSFFIGENSLGKTLWGKLWDIL